MAEKIFILDTNVLVHDPSALYNFKDSIIGIPAIVLEELDKFKGELSERGRNAREATRLLDRLRERGSLQDGVPLDNGGHLRVLFLPMENMPKFPFYLDLNDNKILLTAFFMKQEGYDVRFISKDINARVKADAIGVASEDYVKGHISKDEFYKGWQTIEVPAIELKRDFPSVLDKLVDEKALNVNEFVLVVSQHNPYNYRLFRYLGGRHFRIVHEPLLKWPLKARNPQQLMALDLLLDNSIQFVTLFGPAGTGKTFLALLAGLHKTLIEDEYEKILVSRPVVPLGRDIGYLPGTVEEKLHSWMLPIYDNMEFIMHSCQMGQHIEDLDGDRGERRGKNKKGAKHEKNRSSQGGSLRSMEELVKSGKLSMEAITYMRGRSIPYQFIFIDEVQNLTPHEVKTLVSRVGEGSKIILSGDPYQIDSPYLDFISNGLVVVSERFRGQRVFGTVYLQTSERSELSKLVSELLQ
ncbi:PhoH family protein [soil metagenome]